MENFDINMFFKAGFVLFVIKEFYQTIKSRESEHESSLRKNTEALIELRSELKYFMAQMTELTNRVKVLEERN